LLDFKPPLETFLATAIVLRAAAVPLQVQKARLLVPQLIGLVLATSRGTEEVPRALRVSSRNSRKEALTKLAAEVPELVQSQRRHDAGVVVGSRD